MAESKSMMVKISSLWRMESEKSIGGEYFRGDMGSCYVLLFHNPSSHPKSPEFDLCVINKKRPSWKKNHKARTPKNMPEEAPEPEFDEDTFEDAPPDEGEDEDTEVPW